MRLHLALTAVLLLGVQERLTAQLAEQMAKGAELDAVIREKLGALGYAI